MKTNFIQDPQALARPRVLAVALSEAALADLPRHVLAPFSDVATSTLDDITRADVTGEHAPELILTPLTARGFDPMDLLSLLTVARYRGRVLILTPTMPDIPLIRADVTAEAPTLNVDVMALDGRPALHLI